MNLLFLSFSPSLTLNVLAYPLLLGMTPTNGFIAYLDIQPDT